MVFVRMSAVLSPLWMGIVAGVLAFSAPEANAQNVKCGKIQTDDAEIAAAWADLGIACPCGTSKATKWRKDRQQFVKCARKFASDAVKSRAIRPQCKNDLIKAAKRSTCSRKQGTVTCCKASKNGTRSCSVLKNARKCKASKRQLWAQIGESSSCLDACDSVEAPSCILNTDCPDDGDPCTGAYCHPTEGCQQIVDPFCDPDSGSDPGGGSDDGGGGNDDGGGGSSGGTACSGKGSSTHGLSSREQQLVALINNYRKSKGKGKITACTSLNKAAQDHANDMRDKKYYAHKGADGSEFWERACRAGYQNGCVPNTWMGEIITGWSSTAEGAFQMWKNSPGHDYLMRENLYTVAGIGHACGGPLGNYWVVDFAGANEASCN